MCICGYVSIYVCRYVRMSVGTYVCMCICAHVRMYLITYVLTDGRMCVCTSYNLCNIVKKPTCYKNPINPRSIDLFLTNRSKNYHHSNTVETGLSDHHKMMVTVMKSSFKKAAPHIIKYRKLTYNCFGMNSEKT